jgi:hypothetical protein
LDMPRFPAAAAAGFRAALHLAFAAGHSST